MLDVKFKLFEGHTAERQWMDPSPLRTLFWNTTYACNFKCEICFSSSGQPAADELSTSEAKKLVDHAHAIGVNNFIISGGEPFLRPDLVEVLAHMKARGMRVRVATNGSLLDEALLRRLRAETSVQSFQISIDTLDADHHARLHGVETGLLEQTLETCRVIKRLGFHVTVSTRLTPRTLPEIPALLDRASDEGWATVTVHLPLLSGRHEQAFAQQTDFLSLLEPAFRHFAAMENHWLVETYIPWAEHHPAVQRLEQIARVNHVGCRAGRDRLTVHPRGDVSFCVCFDQPEHSLGNVRRDSLKDIFEQSPVCELMRHPQRHGICKGCKFIGTCGGGCRVAAYVKTGRLDGQDASCPEYQRR